MKWVKASERLPDKAGKYWTKYINHNGEQKTGSLFDGFKFPHHPSGIEWLDESPSVNDASVLKEALENLNDSVDRYWNATIKHDGLVKDINNAQKAAFEALAQYNTQSTSGDNGLIGALEQAVVLIRRWHDMYDRTSDKATLEAIWNIYYGQSPEMKLIRDALHRTPRTPRFQPGELDTVGEHPSDREPEGQYDIVKTENELLSKCLNMLRYLYMNEYCGEHGPEVFELIKAK